MPRTSGAATVKALERLGFIHVRQTGSHVGYALAYFLYRPLRGALPAGAALIVTFALSELVLHDSLLWPASLALHVRPPFPVVTVALSLCACIVLLSERFSIGLDALTLWQRCIAHAACLFFAFGMAISVGVIVHAPTA